MTAKQYLKQVERFERHIRLRKAEIEKLRGMATNIASSQGDGMNIQRTRNMDKMGTVVAKIVDIENAIDALTEKIVVIVDQIDNIGNEDYMELLYLRYIQYKNICEIADSMGYSESHTKRMHNNALECFETKYLIPNDTK